MRCDVIRRQWGCPHDPMTGTEYLSLGPQSRRQLLLRAIRCLVGGLEGERGTGLGVKAGFGPDHSHGGRLTGSHIGTNNTRQRWTATASAKRLALPDYGCTISAALTKPTCSTRACQLRRSPPDAVMVRRYCCAATRSAHARPMMRSWISSAHCRRARYSEAKCPNWVRCQFGCRGVHGLYIGKCLMILRWKGGRVV